MCQTRILQVRVEINTYILCHSSLFYKEGGGREGCKSPRLNRVTLGSCQIEGINKITNLWTFRRQLWKSLQNMNFTQINPSDIMATTSLFEENKEQHSVFLSRLIFLADCRKYTSFRLMPIKEQTCCQHSVFLSRLIILADCRKYTPGKWLKNNLVNWLICSNS